MICLDGCSSLVLSRVLLRKLLLLDPVTAMSQCLWYYINICNRNESIEIIHLPCTRFKMHAMIYYLSLWLLLDQQASTELLLWVLESSLKTSPSKGKRAHWVTRKHSSSRYNITSMIYHATLFNLHVNLPAFTYAIAYLVTERAERGSSIVCQWALLLTFWWHRSLST